MLCYILKDGWTALHWATEKGHFKMATLLINNGCNINITNDVSHTYV